MPRCVIRGENIENTGSRQAVGAIRLDLGSTRPITEVDGCNTNIGPVCQHCLPVYDRAMDEAGKNLPPDASSKQRRKEILGLAGNPEFITRVMIEQSRVELERAIGTLDGQNFPLSKPFLVLLRDLFKPLVSTITTKLAESEPEEGALESTKASACLLDTERTSAFIEVLLARLKELDAKTESSPESPEFPESSESFEVVDAGCGPIPIFGLVAAIRSKKAQITCLELNPASAQIASEIIKNLGLENRVKVLHIDAIKYEHPKKIDLLISETMYTGLMNEPQIQIMRNLCPQLGKEGTVIPREISVEAGLIEPYSKIGTPDFVQNTSGEMPALRDHFVVQPHEVASFTRAGLDQAVSFTLNVSNLPEGDYQVTLGSKIEVGENERGKRVSLEGISSPITAQRPLKQEVRKGDGITKILVSYEPGTHGDKINSTTE